MISFSYAPWAGADEPPGPLTANRPKIGLVLGGGGARGAAHCGVLKVLEAQRIPVDFIVGTSMGSIVGGLYAAGYSPDEIEQLFNEINWNDMLSDRPSEDLLSFRNKKDFQRFSNLELGIKNGKITFPRGVVAGQKLDFLLSKLTIHTVDTPTFDQLRIPFRAIATDAVTGEMVVFDRGNLAQAIRSSMSVPGAFPPVKAGGRILLDGFLTKNVPVEVAQQLGADILIVVDVGTGLLKEEQLKSLLDITTQMINILSQQNVDQSLERLTDKDILIKPELGRIGPGDFVKTPDAVKCGEKTALEQVEAIKRYAVSLEEYQTFLTKQRVRDRNPIQIDFIEVAETQRVNEKMIKGRIKTKPGQPLDFDQLDRDLTNVYAIGDFETVGFNIEEKNGKKGLIINTQEKTWGPEYVRFGFNLQSDTSGANNYTMILDYRHTQLNALGGEWKLAGEIGQNAGVFSEFYQPLDAQNYFFVAPQVGYGRNFRDIYRGDNRLAKYRTTEVGGGLDFGINLKSYLEARAGVRSSVINAKPDIGDTDLPKFRDLHKAGLVLKIDYDQFNDHRFPTKGIKSETTYFIAQPDLGADLSYEKIKTTLAKATTFGSRHTILTALQAGIGLKHDVPFYDEFTLGGIFNLSGLAQDQLHGQNFSVAEVIYYYKLLDTKGFAEKAYLGFSLEAGNVWDKRADFWQDPIYGGSAFIGVDTVLGALYIGYGLAEGYDHRGFVSLGKTF